jgi:hypothetical protein
MLSSGRLAKFSLLGNLAEVEKPKVLPNIASKQTAEIT